jgi:CheY-like chemotaxis protein
VGQIASQVAHDFNNWLAPLVGFPELIKLELPPDHPAQHFCDLMLQSARQMAEVNENLLTLGRRGHFAQDPTDLNVLVEQTIRQQGAVPSTLSVRLDLQAGLWPVVGSAGQLMRVLTNLIVNARDATKEQGTITVRTSNVPGVPTEGREEQVRLDVSDTGPGISPEIQDRIFDAFFTTKHASERSGSGLGLSVVRAIVQDHQGHVEVHSTPGQGATFSLFLPGHPELVVERPTAAIVGGDESILVVDDDAGQREVMNALLSRLGYRVELAPSGEQAIAYLRNHQVDLLILDMRMPGLDGAETYRRILELHPRQRAIIASGYADSDRITAALALGAGTHLRKPLTFEQLAHAVREELDRDKR